MVRDADRVIVLSEGQVLEEGSPAGLLEKGGWFADFAGADMPASSARTRSLLGWQPTGPDLLTDIDQPGYVGMFA